jgi:4-hydroxy-tetrahydrodipicolinate synthase
MRKVLQLRPMIPVMKHLIADARSDPAWRRVRPPLLALPEVEAAALESELSALGWRMSLA